MNHIKNILMGGMVLGVITLLFWFMSKYEILQWIFIAALLVSLSWLVGALIRLVTKK